jgi:hypothetical protein
VSRAERATSPPARDQSLTITALLPDIARVCGTEHPNALLVRNHLAE